MNTAYIHVCILTYMVVFLRIRVVVTFFFFFLMWTFAKCKASIQIKDHTTVLELKGHFNVTSRFGFELVRDLIRPLIAWK